MASTSQAGYGSRLQNTKDLIAKIKSYSKYNPIIDEIKIIAYEPFVNSVETALSNYYDSYAKVKSAQNSVADKFIDLEKLVRKIRNVILEIYGKSESYDDYNELIDEITGDDVSKNYYKRKHETPSTPPPEPGAGDVDFVSVSQLDRGSLIAKFTALIDMLELDPNYTPHEPELTVAQLRAFRDLLNNLLTTLSNAIADFINKRSALLPMFEGPGSLRERAERAKAHVKRQYGPNSPEYKALTGKIY